MRKFELANFEPGSVPRVTIQKIKPDYPEILLVDDETLYQNFDSDQFLKTRREMAQVWRETELKNSWYHRHFFASAHTVVDMTEVLVDGDLNKHCGKEYFVNYSMILAGSGVREGTSALRDADYCLDAVREIYAKNNVGEDNLSKAFFEKLFAHQRKLFGKKAKYQIAEGNVSAMITHTVRNDKEAFTTMLSFKVANRR